MNVLLPSSRPLSGHGTGHACLTRLCVGYYHQGYNCVKVIEQPFRPATSMRVVALAGGVGGAKLADGLYRVLPPEGLSVVVNTADDLDLHGLRVCPDLDTVLYTLAGLADPVQGWGIAGDTFCALDLLGRYGAPTWFRLGDRDLATHIRRTELLRAGARLTEVMRTLADALGVHARLLPMCDEPVATRVRTPGGTLDFQEYFVRRHHADPVLGLEYAGIEEAHVTPEVAAAVQEAVVIVLCPSNPFVSLGPLLAVPGMRDLLRRPGAPIVAVSPIVAGQALRGPAAAMLRTLGHEPSALGVARLYSGCVHGFVLDEADRALAPQVEALGLRALVAPTVMSSPDDRRRLAVATLAFAQELA
jgi:LPPG:FO 2-phospho-L-lactate transferase